METRGMKRLKLSYETEEEVLRKSYAFGEVLLEHLFSFVGVEDLRSCRVVCKAWNEEACRALRKRACALVRGDKLRELPATSSLVRVIGKWKKLSLPIPFEEAQVVVDYHRCTLLLSKLRERGDLLRITHLTVEWEKVNMSHRKNAIVLQKCVLESAPHLQVLNFRDDFYFHQYEPERDVQMETLSFPKLHRLGFTITELSSPNSTEFIVRIINGAPKLRRISIYYSGVRYSSEALQNILTESEPNELEELTLNYVFPRRRHYYVPTPRITRGDTFKLMSFLRKFSQTLQYLSWNFSVPKDVLVNAFPFCPKLAHLQMRAFKFNHPFWEKLPALEVFKCTTLHISPNDYVNGVPNQHSSLKEFTCKCYRNLSERKGSQILRKKFPNVKFPKKENRKREERADSVSSEWTTASDSSSASSDTDSDSD